MKISELVDEIDWTSLHSDDGWITPTGEQIKNRGKFAHAECFVDWLKRNDSVKYSELEPKLEYRTWKNKTHLGNESTVFDFAFSMNFVRVYVDTCHIKNYDYIAGFGYYNEMIPAAKKVCFKILQKRRKLQPMLVELGWNWSEVGKNTFSHLPYREAIQFLQ